MVWRFLKKFKTESPYDPATTLLGIYPKYTKIQIQRGTCTLMLIEALSTIPKLWKEPKCPSTNEWIEEMWYIHKGILLSHPKNEISPFATTWLELECIMLGNTSQLEIDKYHKTSLI